MRLLDDEIHLESNLLDTEMSDEAKSDPPLESASDIEAPDPPPPETEWDFEVPDPIPPEADGDSEPPEVDEDSEPPDPIPPELGGDMKEPEPTPPESDWDVEAPDPIPPELGEDMEEPESTPLESDWDIEAPTSTTGEELSDLPMESTAELHEAAVAQDEPEIISEVHEESDISPGDVTHVIADTSTNFVSSDKFIDEDDDINSKKKRHTWDRVKSNVSTKVGACTRWMFTDRRGQIMLVIGLLAVVTFSIGAPTLMGLAGKSAHSASKAMKDMMKTDYILSAQLLATPSYSGNLSPNGKVTLRFNTDERFLVTLNMEGLEDECFNCRFSIVEATSCADSTLHQYYNQSSGLQNLDSTIAERSTYTAIEGVSTSSVALFTGYDLEEYKNRAIHILDHAQVPLACGILKARARPSTSLRYFATMIGVGAYSVQVSGVVETDFNVDKTFLMSIHVQGVKYGCVGCAIYIHAGDCSVRGERFWNKHHVPSDPWNNDNGAIYTSDAFGGVENQAFWMMDGHDFEAHDGKAVVMYDGSGAAVACGLLSSRRGYIAQPTLPPASNTVQLIHMGA